MCSFLVVIGLINEVGTNLLLFLSPFVFKYCLLGVFNCLFLSPESYEEIILAYFRTGNTINLGEFGVSITIETLGQEDARGKQRIGQGS